MKKAIINLLIIIFVVILAGCSSNAPNADVTEDTTPDVPVAADDPIAEDEPVIPLAEPDPVPEGVILAIYGNGVDGQTNWTLEELQALDEGYREITFSTTNNWPSFTHMIGHGVSVPYLLEQAGIRSDAETLIFLAPDGYQARIAIDQIYETRYAFSQHSAEGSGGAEKVEPIVAWAWGEDEAEPGYLRPMFGQLGPYDVNTAASVKDLYRIEVSTQNAGVWAEPIASIPSGSSVSAGAGLELSHPNMDNIKLYYTLDGSDPDYNSEVYNKSTSYFQPDLIVPIVIKEGITLKVFAGGLGKADSGIVSLTYTVS